jgi:predicted NBD/HSP70 family sugar kinase
MSPRADAALTGRYVDAVGQLARTVADAMRARGACTRGELVAATGLSRPVVSTAVSELVELGFAEPVGPEEEAVRGVGRPAERLRLTRRAGLALGVDAGRRHVTVVLTDAGQRELAPPLTRSLSKDSDQHPEQALDLAHRLSLELLERVGGSLAEVIGVGLGIPAPVGLDGTVGRSSTPAWPQADPAAGLRDRLGGVPVVLGNDASFGALCEAVRGAGAGFDPMVYLKAGTGIGAGIVLGGELYVGFAGTAGEIGHITVDASGWVCPCGNKGCVELYAGGLALLRRAERSHPDLRVLDDLVQLARDGDPLCRTLIAEAGEYLAVALGAVVNLLSPQAVIIGGGLADAGTLLLTPLRERLARGAAMGKALEGVRVEPAKQSASASAWGAVLHVLRRGGASHRAGRQPGETATVRTPD